MRHLAYTALFLALATTAASAQRPRPHRVKPDRRLES